MIKRVFLILAAITLFSTCEKAPTPKHQLAQNKPNEERFETARKYAPIIFQHTVKNKERLDYITGVDYDGDLIGNNNWDNLEAGYPLAAKIYYAILETETHYFISYGVYHPRDWSALDSGIFYDSHENDMENIQIVVRKGDHSLLGQIEILLTQAHLGSHIYISKNSAISGREKEIDGYLETVGDDKKPDPNSTHVGIYVQSGGHGIYGISDKKSKAIIEDTGFVDFDDKNGVVYFPCKNEEECAPPGLNNTGAFYRIESTYEKFWIPFTRGELYGNGKLFDGLFSYKDGEFDYPRIPRYFDSDRLSGIGKKDSGISPFALGFTLLGKDKGGLFFNPAKNYPDKLRVVQPWSRNYIYHPY